MAAMRPASLRARVPAAALAAAIVALASSSGAAGTPPRIAAIHARDHVAVVSFVGYDRVGRYGVELSTSTKVRDGHFADPLRSAELGLPPDLSQTARFHGLAPGLYYARVSHDYTAAYRARWRELCRKFGCRSPWRGQRVLEW